MGFDEIIGLKEIAPWFANGLADCKALDGKALEDVGGEF